MSNPTPKLIRSSYSTVEELREEIRGNSYDLYEVLQKSEGAFNSSHSTYILQSSVISQRFMEAAAIHRMHIREDVVKFILLDTQQPVRINGETMDDSGLYLVTPGEYMVSDYPENTRSVSFEISREKLEQFVDPEVVNKAMERSAVCRHKAFSHQFEMMKNVLKKTAESLFDQIDFPSIESLKNAEESLLQSIEKLFHQIENYDDKPKASRRFLVVKRAIEYLDACESRSITVEQLAKESFSSIRGLEYAFKDVIGMTPKRYLLLRRMHNIRHELLSGRATSVTALLQSYGVVNWGRFSKDYRVLFGEHPKDTLVRANGMYPS